MAHSVSMQIGVIYPQTELPPDPATVGAYAAEVEQLGYRHLLVYDRVLGADPETYPDWNGPYDIDTTFHEPFVLFGFLAAATSLELVTGIIISPQRQTALLAKQAAEVAILSEGRFRLGLGVGWNAVEYEALGQDFSTRGRRQEEQIEVLRRLWTERAVTYEGRFDHLRGAGLAPRPAHRIPIWLGGSSGAAYRRIGRLADGWFPQVPPGDHLADALETIGESARSAGRDPSAIEMEGRISNGPGGLDELVRHLGKWQDAGATHVGVNTMRSDLGGDVQAHLEVLRALARELEL